MAEWRFHLRSVPSGTWVDRELPLQDAKVTQTVSAPLGITGYLPLGNASGKTLKEWGSMIVAHQDGRLPVVAIVDSLSTEGDFLKIEAGGFAMYPAGMPWNNPEFSSTNVDPLTVVRLIWDMLQSKTDGDLGVVVDSEMSGVRLGVSQSSQLTAAKLAAANAKLSEASGKAAYEAEVRAHNASKVALLNACGRPAKGMVYHQDTAPWGSRRTRSNVWVDKNDSNKAFIWNLKAWVPQKVTSQAGINALLATWLAGEGEVASAKADYEARKKRHTDAKKRLSDVDGGEAEPFVLNWWETLDLGNVIDTLATNTPFEYREESRWANADMDELTHRLELGHPSLGSRRTDLRFEVGVNVTVAPALQEGEYASVVTVLGAGEGRAMVHSSATGLRGRLRRSLTLQRKDLRTPAQTARAARVEVADRAAEWAFDTIELLDHSMAPYGSFRAGDQILVTGDAGWRQLNNWVRVLEISVDCNSGSMTLRVEVV